ncbi:hypothetical protein [Vibrio splendidus]|uniref:hypothetical protein n=1 Tax=Vibrio splendidus TaxID=29497 RepID=UPI0006CA2EB7|nr:hypothetical protein [Vibrio splendidus]KPL99883.1 hypothetical protein AN167_10620 [Vibrio splendidus]
MSNFPTIQSLKNKLIPTKESAKQIAELAENAIDSFIPSEALAELPFVSTAVQLKNATDAYQIAKLKRNYAAFLKGPSEGVSTEEATQFTDKVFADNEKAQEAAETIFDIITESERPYKAEILGNLTVAFAKENISLEEYTELMHITRSATMPALRSINGFIEFSNGKVSHNSGIQQYEREGLLFSIGVFERQGTRGGLNSLGEMLAIHGLRHPSLT